MKSRDMIARFEAPGNEGWRAWLLAPQRRPTLYLLASMTILYGIALVRYPGSVFSNEPRFEEGTNLFYYAYYENLWRNLWAVDCGYLTSLPRLFSVILVKVFGMREHFFLAIHLIGPAIVAFMASVFILAPFRRLVRSDEARFVLSLGCGSEMAFGIDSYNLCFFNIAYFGAALPLLALCLDHERLGRKAFILLAAITAILLTSKPYFITFLPLYALCMAYGVRVKRRWTTLFAAIGVGTILLQTCVMYLHRSEVATRGMGKGLSEGYRPLAFLKDDVLSLLSTYIEVFLNRADLPTNRSFVAILYGLTALLIVWLAWALRKRDKLMFWFFVGANAVAAASLAISLLGADWRLNEVDRYIPVTRLANVLPMRHYAFSSILITFGTLVCLLRLLRGRQAQAAMAVAFCLIVYDSQLYYPIDDDKHKVAMRLHEPVSQRFSHWDRYHRLADDVDCFIPVQTYPWAIKRGNDYLNPDPAETVEKQPASEVKFTEEQQASWRLRGVLIVGRLPSTPDSAAQDNKPVRAVAYDAKNNRLAVAEMLSPPGCDYIYLLFPRKLERVARLAFVDEAGQPRPVVLRIRYFGS